MGTPFAPLAHWFRIPVTLKDIDYLQNVIKKHKCYPLIRQSFILAYEPRPNDYSRLQRCYADINLIVVYDRFYHDKKCPQGIKIILFVHLGLLRDYVDNFSPTLLSYRYPYVEQWMNRI